MANSDYDWSLLDQIPALPPPPGVKSDFNHPETREELARIVVGLTYGLMLIFLALRIYARVKFTNSLGIDDYLSLAAGASITAFTGLSLSLFGNPLGPHQWNVPLSHFNESFLGRTLSSIVMFSVSSLFVKTALLSLYLRVFAPSPTARVMIWLGIVTIVVFYTISVILNIRFCTPLSMTTPVPDEEEWAKKLEASNCSQPVYNLNAAVGLFGVVSDIYVLVIPISMVYGLRMPRNRKLGILGIFLTGLLAVALSITSSAFRVLQLKSYDFTWDSIPSYTLRAAELNVGLICSCMPVVFVVLKRILQPGSRPSKRVPTPRTRTPSHAYISDLERGDDIADIAEYQFPSAPAPIATISLKSFTQQSYRLPTTRGRRSTYSEIRSTNSDDSNNSRDSG
ncbi:hypothetical protein F5B22DRAFT_506582 [Xylaria bambusicola]|uniref:uncharacterized protein n=1 Tax=Xylaria bambusicola TaxID=326684 RepID=UPI0020080AB0|nr:uncharacterized protein F5B22DRAFT_506582 [Xylaria bambusicola]KAI0521860.1 hypothetical protein F5B22DRAFT_506582 [Xylaria bambusicola]